MSTRQTGVDDLDGRVVVVTGGASGIGAAACERVADQGGVAIALDLPGESSPRAALRLDVDVTDAAAIQNAADEVVRRYGRVDGIVAAAGVLRPGGALDIDLDDWRLSMDVNVTGILQTVRAFTPPIIAGGRGGSVVLVGSIRSRRTLGGFVAYVTSKHAVLGLAGALAHELGPEQIRVNTILPSAVATPMVGAPDYSQIHLLPVPHQVPQDVAGVIGWLLSDEARFLTAVELPVDAGYLAR